MYSGPPVNVHDVSYGSGYGNPAYQVEAAHPQAFHIPGQSSAYMVHHGVPQPFVAAPHQVLVTSTAQLVPNPLYASSMHGAQVPYGGRHTPHMLHLQQQHTTYRSEQQLGLHYGACPQCGVHQYQQHRVEQPVAGLGYGHQAGPTGFDTTLSQSTSAAFNPTQSDHRPSHAFAVSAQSLVPQEQRNPNTAASYNYSSGYGMSHEAAAAGQGRLDKSGNNFSSLPQGSSMSVPKAAGGPTVFGSKGRYFSPNMQR
ncbi:TPA: hypothetical protein ACH3X2_012876 [Trebouxia sp. C0005]